MIRYLIEASEKRGLFEPCGQRRRYIVTQEKLSNLLVNKFSWVVWSATWINLELTPMEHLKAVYGEIEVMG